MTTLTFQELKTLWTHCGLGKLPPDTQFITWLAMHQWETVKYGIAKAAAKNVSLNGEMSLDYKVRFASKVMRTRTTQGQMRTTGGLI